VIPDLRPPIRPIHFFLILAPVLASLHPSRLASGQSTSEGQELNDRLSIQQAGLRWLMKNMDKHPSGDLKTVCLQVREDRGRGVAKEEVSAEERQRVERFVRDEFDLRPAPSDRCGRQMTPEGWGRGYIDPETTDPAGFLVFTWVSVPAQGNATIEIGFHLGPLWGQGWRCEVDRRDNGWEVHGCWIRWTS